MIRGYSAKLVFSKSGNLVAIATGSDFCAEHECGSKKLIQPLCAQYDNESAVIDALRKRSGGLASILPKAIVPTITYPSLLESKRIVKKPEALRFVERKEGEPEAILYCNDKIVDFNHRELIFYKHESQNNDKNVTGAWDEQSFAIRVRGEKYVRALRRFHEAILGDKVVFAGKFFERPERLNGVILANTEYLTENDRENIKSAQAKYESELRLKAADDTDALKDEMRNVSGLSSLPGFIWARWKSPQEEVLMYALNPGHGVKAQYIGPYTRKQMVDWAKKKYSYHLKPEPAPAEPPFMSMS